MKKNLRGEAGGPGWGEGSQALAGGSREVDGEVDVRVTARGPREERKRKQKKYVWELEE